MTYERQKYFLGIPIPGTREALSPASAVSLSHRTERDQYGERKKHITSILHLSANGKSAVVLKESDAGFFSTTVADRYTTEDPAKFNDAKIRSDGFVIYTRYRDK